MNVNLYKHFYFKQSYKVFHSQKKTLNTHLYNSKTEKEQ